MSEMVFIYILFFAVIMLAGVCGIMEEKKIDELVQTVNQLDTLLANYSIVLNNTKWLAEKTEDEYAEARRSIDALVNSCEERAREIEALQQRIEELPLDEFIETQKQEAAYMQGMQNIFNYGGEIQRLNVEALKHE